MIEHEKSVKQRRKSVERNARVTDPVQEVVKEAGTGREAGRGARPDAGRTSETMTERDSAIWMMIGIEDIRLLHVAIEIVTIDGKTTQVGAEKTGGSRTLLQACKLVHNKALPCE